jgi:hypothetical protein
MNDTDRLIVNLSPEEKEAFLKGYTDCKSGMRNKGSSSIVQPTLRPPVGFETTYKDGWRKASEEVVDEAEKKAHHGYALGFITLGGFLILVGLVMIAVQSVSGTAQLNYSLTITVSGFVFAITGVVKYFSKVPID